MKNFHLKSAFYLVVLRIASIVKNRAKSGDKVIKYNGNNFELNKNQLFKFFKIKIL